MDQIKIGKFISLCRKNKGLTQEQLAEKLGVSINAVSKWDRGINLPDVSIMQNLCSILGVSLNELFAGEYLKENEIKKQSEKNIIDVLKFSNNKYKKCMILIITISILLFISFILLGNVVLIKLGYIMDPSLKYSRVYISGEDGIKGDVDINYFAKKHIDFVIGANKYGYAVFKNPSKALNRLKKDYSKGIKLIQKEFKLQPLTRFNYIDYKTYGWQVTTGTEEEKEQASFVTVFMDIYENSFYSSK